MRPVNGSLGILCGTLAMLFPMPAASQSPEFGEVVAATLQYLRDGWGPIVEPERSDSNVLEVRDGRIHLGQARLAQLSAEPENRHRNVLLLFFVAHEAWHTFQIAAHTNPVEFQRLRGNRILECEADFMGAMATAQQIEGMGGTPVERLRARNALVEYVRTHSTASQDAQYYPTAEMRAATIDIAWQQVVNPRFLRRLASGVLASPPTRTPQTVARDFCTTIASVHDGSIGGIEFASIQRETADGESSSGTPSGRTYDVRIHNFDDRPIEVTYMLVGNGRVRVGEDWLSEVYDAIEHRVVVPSRGNVEQDHTMRDYPVVAGGNSAHSMVMEPLSYGSSGRLIATRYADARSADGGYCYTRIGSVEGSDRALLYRLATIALSASEDFRPLAESESIVGVGGTRRYRFAAGLGQGPQDGISVPAGRYANVPNAELTALPADRPEAVLAEFGRLTGVLALVCGADALRAEPPNEDGGYQSQTITLLRFAPGAFVDLDYTLFPNLPDAAGRRPPGYRSGIVILRIARDSGW